MIPLIACHHGSAQQVLESLNHLPELEAPAPEAHQYDLRGLVPGCRRYSDLNWLCH